MRIYKLAKSMYDDMSEKDFLKHHYTGGIPSDAYERYTQEDNDFFAHYTKENCSRLIHSGTYGGLPIEFRQKGEKLEYCLTDENGNRMYDEQGNILMATDEQIKERGFSPYETTVVAFHGDKTVGVASDEWGTDGIWVLENYQRKGIGTELLSLLRKQFKESRKIGQMTNAGINMTRAYYRKLQQEKENKKIPDGKENQVLP